MSKSWSVAVAGRYCSWMNCSKRFIGCHAACLGGLLGERCEGSNVVTHQLLSTLAGRLSTLDGNRSTKPQRSTVEHLSQIATCYCLNFKV